MINEAEKRRTDFIEGEPIKLEGCDTPFHFPKPRVEYRIVASEEGGYGGMARSQPTETNRRFGDRYWKLRDGLTAAHDGAEDAAIFSAWGAIAVDLLARNYDLTMGEMGDLMPIIPGDPENDEMWGAIVRLALGLGKKTDAVT